MHTRRREASAPRQAWTRLRARLRPCWLRGQRPALCVRPRPQGSPAGGNLLELDEHLRGDVQLVDDRVDDVGVIVHLHLHVVAVTVSDRKEHPVSDVENLPVRGAERLGQSGKE